MGKVSRSEAESLRQLLDYPNILFHEFPGWKVPDVLLSEIAEIARVVA